MRALPANPWVNRDFDRLHRLGSALNRTGNFVASVKGSLPGTNIKLLHRRGRSSRPACRSEADARRDPHEDSDPRGRGGSTTVSTRANRGGQGLAMVMAGTLHAAFGLRRKYSPVTKPSTGFPPGPSVRCRSRPATPSPTPAFSGFAKTFCGAGQRGFGRAKFRVHRKAVPARGVGTSGSTLGGGTNAERATSKGIFPQPAGQAIAVRRITPGDNHQTALEHRSSESHTRVARVRS